MFNDERSVDGKGKFVKTVGEVICGDPRSRVAFLEYTPAHEHYHGAEVVHVHYVGGSRADINVTGNSLGAIFREIAREVYGTGAHGRMGV